MLQAQSSQAQPFTEKLIFNFVSNDGVDPLAGLVRDNSGNLYGTTSYEGPHQNGTVFKLEPSGNFTVLYGFTGGADGGTPRSNLLLDATGNVFGTTTSGGAYNSGTVFEISPDGTETVLHSFGNGNDGKTPFAGLVRDRAGNLYGTTVTGGAHQSGTVFRINAAGLERVLYSFTGGNDGLQPFAGVVLDPSGNIYGCAQYGGASGDGTLFKLDRTGKLTVLYNFAQLTGSYPNGVVRDAAGNFYGTTRSGGTNDDGTVFKVSNTGQATVLHNFGSGTDGQYPYAPLIRDSAGNLYGTTYGGGSGRGTIFKVDASGSESVIYAFAGDADGDAPVGSLVRDAAGNLYGTTVYGGLGGTIFEISPQK